MALHARQVALAAGAPPDRVDQVAAQLIVEGRIRATRAAELVSQLKAH
jgi:hydroxymethylglutaryl-CoA reductase